MRPISRSTLALFAALAIACLMIPRALDAEPTPATVPAVSAIHISDAVDITRNSSVFVSIPSDKVAQADSMSVQAVAHYAGGLEPYLYGLNGEVTAAEQSLQFFGCRVKLFVNGALKGIVHFDESDIIGFQQENATYVAGVKLFESVVGQFDPSSSNELAIELDPPIPFGFEGAGSVSNARVKVTAQVILWKGQSE